jgi:hypothetical protein
VTVDGSAGAVRFEAFEPQIGIAADALTGMTGTVTVSVVQIGDYAESRPASVPVALGGGG